MSLLTRKNARCGVSSSSLSRRSLRVFPSLTWCLATVLYISLSLLRWLFGAEDRWLLREQRFLMGRAVRSPSTCLKTPQNCSKEGRLKPFFANNVDIPFARARRLKPCPRKATVRSGKHMHLLHSLYQIRGSKTFKTALYYHVLT